MQGKPVLVLLDFANRYARRYIPQPTGGFYREQAAMGARWSLWGGLQGLTLIERFRDGRLLTGQKR